MIPGITILRTALVIVCLSVGALIQGCASDGTVASVTVTAVNYTGGELNGFLFIDPANEDKVAGGTGATPYSGTGAMCCYGLPLKWRPGIQVKLRYDWWEDSGERRYQYLTTELPPYPTGEPGVLWALFYTDGSVQVLASAVDPGHEKWPGKAKSWPVPSREYRLKKWQMMYDQIASLQPYYEQMSRGFDPAELSRVWEHRARYAKKSIAGFSGPDDPRFKEFLMGHGAESLRRDRLRLLDLEKVKP